jgi:hypothetical protein
MRAKRGQSCPPSGRRGRRLAILFSQFQGNRPRSRGGAASRVLVPPSAGVPRHLPPRAPSFWQFGDANSRIGWAWEAGDAPWSSVKCPCGAGVLSSPQPRAREAYARRRDVPTALVPKKLSQRLLKQNKTKNSRPHQQREEGRQAERCHFCVPPHARQSQVLLAVHVRVAGRCI